MGKTAPLQPKGAAPGKARKQQIPRSPRRPRDDSNSERSSLGYLDSGPTLGSPICLLYSAVSEGEQYISRMSNPRGCKRRGNLLRACQGCVYILGSSIVTVSSMLS